MSKLFYPKLAVSNIKKNGKFYLPYILTSLGIIGMFYIMCAISFNDGMSSMPSAQNVQTIMALGCIVIGIFSLIFLFYTNSFLMKRRKKELGLYNILGMEKRHIGKILFFETVFIFILSTVLGLTVGIVLDKLMTLFLYKLLGFSVPLKFSVSVQGIILTLLLFGFIFFLILLSNFVHLKLSKPIELLHGSNTGEKEPKTKLLLTILGVLCLGGGYWIALTTESPLEAMNLFFIAVLLVIAGTFLLFTTGSIALLKLLRKNKGYYYKTKHFTSVSGMIYRMKQNAAGLSNICILSTMVLVMVSTTVSMYIGVDDALVDRYPTDLAITVMGPEEGDCERTIQKIENTVKNQGRTMSDLSYYEYLSFIADRNGDSFTTNQDLIYNSQTAVMTFMTAEEYSRLTGGDIVLAENEIILYNKGEPLGNKIDLFGTGYIIKERLQTIPIVNESTTNLAKTYIIIVSDDSVVQRFYDIQRGDYQENVSRMKLNIKFNLDGTDQQKIDCYNAVADAVKTEVPYSRVNDQGETVEGSYYVSYVESRQDSKAVFYALYGGLLFLGLFLGLLFLMATVLIIYYKQISEGYDDKNRFEIMQKVGMSRTEVKASIRSQVLKVFFIPIAMAAIHILAAFKMITKLLALMNLTNVPLFALCTVSSVIIFSAIYALVYAMTAKVYYKIVS